MEQKTKLNFYGSVSLKERAAERAKQLGLSTNAYIRLSVARQLESENV